MCLSGLDPAGWLASGCISNGLAPLRSSELAPEASQAGVRKRNEIAAVTLRANVFLSPGARFHPVTESRSMGETAFANCVHSRCLPALKKPPALAVSAPATC